MGMKCGSRMALGVAGGYLLGRSRKMKLATFLAIVAAGGKHPGELLRRVPVLGEGGPLDELTGDLRGRLVDAGKSAAMAAASNRIDSLSDRLQQRADLMRGTRAAPEEEYEEEAEPRPRSRRERTESEEEPEPRAEYEEEPEPGPRSRGEYEEEPEPGPRPRRERAEYEEEAEPRPRSRRERAEYDAEYDSEEPEERPARPRMTHGGRP
jgi:hypothetical protein